MSTLSRSQRVMLAAGAAIAALAVGAGCGPADTPPAAPQPAVDPSTTPTPDQALGEGSGDGQGTDGGSGQGSGGGSGGSGGGSGSGGSGSGGSGSGGSGSGGSGSGGSGGSGGWPSPEDCISYNPANLTVNFDPNGIYNLLSGSTLVLRVYGEQGDNTGDKVLALAKRYRKHCYIGRSNTRDEERGNYIFDYWRDPSGQKPTIPDQEEDCSSYDPGNLRADDMGSGYGWRVRDDDHVLHVFDNESDAKKGKQVLAKYHKICFIGDPGDLGRDVIGYML